VLSEPKLNPADCQPFNVEFIYIKLTRIAQAAGVLFFWCIVTISPCKKRTICGNSNSLELFRFGTDLALYSRQ